MQDFPLAVVPRARETGAVNRFQALLIVFALWALIYLPGLGSPPLKGEEGRRILPALTMLESGNYLVPHIGGVPYLRKPPLLNWAIAATVRLAGRQSEWAARLPSALSILGAAAALVLVAGHPGWLGVPTALVAAVFFLTQIATIEKGRLAEIEALYFTLGGSATVLWLAWWGQGRSRWLLWLVPCTLLGFGLLAKAPLHLLFFYATVLAVLGYTREWKVLAHPAHFLGLLLMGGIFAAWWWPYSHTAAAQQALEVWKAQSLGRFSGPFDVAGWATNIPRGLTNHLPWLLLAPLLWRSDLEGLGPRERALFRGTRLAVLATFTGVLLIPGMLPRYTLPLLAPFAMLLAYATGDERLSARPFALRTWWRANCGLAGLVVLLALACPAFYAAGRQRVRADHLHFPGRYSDQFELVLAAAAGALVLALFVLLGRRKLARPSLLATASGTVVGAAMLLWAAAGIPWLNAADRLRPAAMQIDSALPMGVGLHVVDIEYQPVLFYLGSPFIVTPDLDSVPEIASDPSIPLPQRLRKLPWLLTRAEKRKKLQEERPEYVLAEEIKDQDLVLLKPEGQPKEERKRKKERGPQEDSLKGAKSDRRDVAERLM